MMLQQPLHVDYCVQWGPHIVRGRSNHDVGDLLEGLSILRIDQIGDVPQYYELTLLLVKKHFLLFEFVVFHVFRVVLRVGVLCHIQPFVSLEVTGDVAP